MIRLLQIIIGLFLLLSASLTLANAELIPRHIPEKPATATIAPGFDRSLIELKFRDGDDIGLDASGIPHDRTGKKLKGSAIEILGTIKAEGGTFKRLTPLKESLMDELVAKAQYNLGREIADMNNYFLLEVPKGASTEEWLNNLNSLDDIEIALARPLAMVLPTPDFTGRQGYLGAAPSGIGAQSVWSQPGGTGNGCGSSVICDFEYSWNLSHQDIGASYSNLIPPGYTASDPMGDNNHGTAVLGEMTSYLNDYGTVGASYGCIQWAAPTYLNGSWLLDISMQYALNQCYWRHGVVFLIEQQIAGPNYTGVPTGNQDGLVPVEWWLSFYNTILTCIGNGVIVVETAGNGREDLDNAVYSTGNGGHWPFLSQNNSGAIIVGGGHAPTAYGGTDVDRARIGNATWGSNYGSRVDMQGWGEMVTTTGYGRLYSLEGVDLYYDSLFSGTSSASPMVASAAAIIQAMRREASGCPLNGMDYGYAFTPAEVTTLLKLTGSSQQAGTHPISENIGPRPNLAAAITYDGDGDGIAYLSDNCPNTYNPGQEDLDGDFIGDDCDACTDVDNDGFGEPGMAASTCPVDNCPIVYNPGQEDPDLDGIGSACDNCPDDYNPGQEDSDSDGIGDACEGCCEIVGDINHSGGGPDISDLVYLVTYMFSGGPVPPCIEEADINGSGGGPDISDLVYLVTYMFSGGPAPMPCP